jgi:hypothetical protein
VSGGRKIPATGRMGGHRRWSSSVGGPVELVEAFGGIGLTGECRTAAGVERLLGGRRLVGAGTRGSTRAGGFARG